MRPSNCYIFLAPPLPPLSPPVGSKDTACHGITSTGRKIISAANELTDIFAALSKLCLTLIALSKAIYEIWGIVGFQVGDPGRTGLNGRNLRQVPSKLT